MTSYPYTMTQGLVILMTLTCSLTQMTLLRNIPRSLSLTIWLRPTRWAESFGLFSD